MIPYSGSCLDTVLLLESQTNEVFAIRKRRKTFAVEMGAPARPSDIQRSFLSGAGGGARTRTVVTPRDFKSLVSAIPPHRQAGIF